MPATSTILDTSTYRDDAAAHLWRHFAYMADVDENPLRVITRGDGCYLIDSEGNRYLDALSNLFCVNLGYSYGEEMGEAALEQYRELGYHSNWGNTHPRAIELARKIAELTPEGLDHVHLTPSGGEGVEAAWKIARQYFRLKGENRFKAIARQTAYHGTTLGALSLIGLPELREPFEPLVPGALHIRNTKRFGRPEEETEEQFTAFLLDDLEHRIVAEGPETVAMIIMEPVQNHGGMLVPPAGYSAGVRALADKYGILLVSDETITAFGRLGHWFASERYDTQPDILTMAKGLSSAHAVIGAVAVNDRVYEPFERAGVSFVHGNTFGGHPVMAAVALKNIEIMERLDIPGHVRSKEQELGDMLRGLLEIPVVRDVRGAGFFWAIELTSNRVDGSPLTDDQRALLYGQGLLRALEEHGVMLRIAIDEGDPVICIAPPLVADTEEFTVIRNALTAALTLLDEVHRNL